MEYDIRKLQQAILIIMDEIHRICQEHNITYSICGGTLLGAVRHEGFIPWDDDLDIMMIRSEYERFISICKKELSTEKFYLQTQDTDEYYAFAFAKIQLKGTLFLEEWALNVDIPKGIFVDIFPLDNLPVRKKLFLKVNHVLKNMLWVKCGYGTREHQKRISYWIIQLISFPISIKRIKNIRFKLITTYNKGITGQYFSSDYPNVIYYTEWFLQMKLYNFENRNYFGICKAQEYLTDQYGNYRELPPIEERRSHSVCDIDFGEYR